MSKEQKKFESVADFLARNGQITRVPENALREAPRKPSNGRKRFLFKRKYS